MRVEEVMTRIAVCLSEDNTCAEALQLLSEVDCSGLPVMDKTGKLLGVVTTKSLIERLSSNERSFAELSCLAAVEYDLVVIRPSLLLENAWASQFDLAVVIGDDGRVVGMLSREDLAVALYRNVEFLIKEQTKEFEAILSSSQNGIVVIDKDGRITAFNQAAQQFSKVPYEKAIGRYVPDVHILDVSVTLGLMDTLKTGKSEYAKKFRVSQETYSMNRVPIIRGGRIYGAICVFQDISDIEAISREFAVVQELNDEYDSIIQSFSDGIIITDPAGIILKYNKTFEKLSLSNTADMTGRKIQEIEEVSYAHFFVDLVRQRRQIVTLMENMYNHCLLVTGTPVFDKEGKLAMVVINLKDMTYLSRLQKELTDAKLFNKKPPQKILELSESENAGEMIGVSAEMKQVFELAHRVAKVDSTVLILGESGVGKEGVGLLLHTQSNRAAGPFIKINCGSIPEHLLESELFGYESGAFTGARREGKPGLFELAHNGTLLLDEIGDFPLSLQPKLLRVIQEKEFVPVGGTKPRQVNVRILAATNRNLEEMISEGQFREDLFFRLNVVPVSIPPLRQRREDIVPLVDHFRDRLRKKYGLQREFSPEVINVFLKYDWPGNVRELENMVERLMVVSSGEVITLSDLPDSFKQSTGQVGGVSVDSLMPLRDAVYEVERQLIDKAMEKYGSTYKAAAALGVNQSTIVRRMARFRRAAAELSAQS